MALAFRGRLIEWRGPAPYFFVPLPAPAATDVREVAAVATYGWGVVPVEASVGGVRFGTSLFPSGGGYLLPLKAAVRLPLGLEPGDEVDVDLEVVLSHRRPG